MRGGVRPGAGRPKGSGKFGSVTRAVRIPVGDIDKVYQFLEQKCNRLPLYQDTISAGFPSSSEDQIDEFFDLNELLVRQPVATFLLKVSGSSMIKAGIHHGDILIVDRSIAPTSGKIVIAAVNGELTVKRLFLEAEKVQLVAENDAYRPIDISEDMDLRIWGVVTNVIHPL